MPNEFKQKRFNMTHSIWGYVLLKYCIPINSTKAKGNGKNNLWQRV